MAAIKPSFMPKLTKPVAKEVETPVAATVTAPTPEPEVETGEVMTEEIAVPETTEKKARKKSDKERAKPNRQMTPEDTVFVISNVKTMSYSEIAEARGITKHQVNRVLMQVKKDLREKCGGDAEKLAKIEAYIKETLSRPEDAFPGSGAGRGGAVKESIDSIVGNILAGI